MKDDHAMAQQRQQIEKERRIRCIFKQEVRKRSAFIFLKRLRVEFRRNGYDELSFYRKITEITRKMIYAEKYKQLFGKGDTITKFRLWNSEKKLRKIRARGHVLIGFSHSSPLDLVHLGTSSERAHSPDLSSWPR